MKTLCVLILATLMVASIADQANIVYYNAFNATQYSNDLSTIVDHNMGTIRSLAIPDVSDNVSFNFSNIKVVSMAQQTVGPLYDVNATNSSIIINQNPVFTANVTFDFSFNNSGAATGSNFTGNGFAILLTNEASLSRYFGTTQDNKPFVGCPYLDWQWVVPLAKIIKSDFTSDVPTDSILKTFQASVAPRVATLNASILDTCERYYADINGAWNVLPEFQVPLTKGFFWNNTYHFNSINATDKAILATSNGIIFNKTDAYTVLADSNTAKIPLNDKPKQVAYSIEGVKNFVKYAMDGGFILGNFDRDIYPLPTFDYTINDLTDIVPSLINASPLTAFVEFTCIARTNPNLTFGDGINLDLGINCGVNPIGKPDLLLNVTFDVKVNVLPQTPSYGAVNFNLASINYVPKSAIIPGQTLSALQTSILEYHVTSALRSIPGTRYSRQVYGSGIDLPWKRITDVQYTYDENWMYITGN